MQQTVVWYGIYWTLRVWSLNLSQMVSDWLYVFRIHSTVLKKKHFPIVYCHKYRDQSIANVPPPTYTLHTQC
jgi:hypothetical protein